MMARDAEIRFLQANLNCSWAALDLLKHYALEAGISLCAISEPPVSISDNGEVFTSENKRAAVFRCGAVPVGGACGLVARSESRLDWER